MKSFLALSAGYSAAVITHRFGKASGKRGFIFNSGLYTLDALMFFVGVGTAAEMIDRVSKRLDVLVEETQKKETVVADDVESGSDPEV